MADLRVEGLVMQQLSGHCCFPYLYGFTEAGALIMEHICSKDQKHDSTLRSFVKTKGTDRKGWFNIARKLVEALSFLHNKGILHNDIHGENILIRPNGTPCLIDFEKATLIEAPLMYDIIPGSKEHSLLSLVIDSVLNN